MAFRKKEGVKEDSQKQSESVRKGPGRPRKADFPLKVRLLAGLLKATSEKILLSVVLSESRGPSHMNTSSESLETSSIL